MKRCADTLDSDSEFVSSLQQRAKLIGEKVQYAAETDVVPKQQSVATYFRIDASGIVHEAELDLLGSNFWGIKQVLSR
jgi:hypothetical protein